MKRLCRLPPADKRIEVFILGMRRCASPRCRSNAEGWLVWADAHSPGAICEECAQETMGDMLRHTNESWKFTYGSQYSDMDTTNIARILTQEDIDDVEEAIENEKG